MTAQIELLFGSDEAIVAFDEWKCNCGPSALAAVTGTTLDAIRPIVESVGFAAKGYMNPTMMKQSVIKAGWRVVKEHTCGRFQSPLPHCGLARIQWEGPWTAEGANPKWAYWHTHWVASWQDNGGPILFDVNGGLMRLEEWVRRIVPLITSSIKRATGGWYLTHSWEVMPIEKG